MDIEVYAADRAGSVLVLPPLTGSLVSPSFPSIDDMSRREGQEDDMT